MTARAQTVTILFTDLVGSTELLQRAGDEQAQRIFKAHHRLLREAVEAHGGREVKWLGDGLMVAFDSAADAVKCAIAMQQSSRRPTAGERLEIRAGLNVGEAFVDESDYFGASVVIARRLCDSGGAGEIRASEIVVRLLDGRGDGVRTNDLGPLELKGITNPVPAVEIVYDHDPMALLRRLPFVGRDAEYETLLKKLAEARNSRGSVVMLAGEPGIGKTRLTEEFCDHAQSSATVIRGNCFEGAIAAPFGPWVEALRSLMEQLPDAELREVLGAGAPDIAIMIPEIRRRLADLEESPRLDPESERARLFESIGAFLRNVADKRPLVIFLDDLHWCDRPSLALLEQLARACSDKRIVIVGTYRDVEVDRVHPLAATLANLRRMEHHERINVRGFTQDSVYDLLHAIEPSDEAEEARRGLAQVLFNESEGNPFFLREVLHNLIETGKLAQQDGIWTGTVASIQDLGIPEGIKEVIGRRLSRLSEACNRMLGRAAALTGGFTWDELRAITDESDDDLLAALDEALGSQLIAERGLSRYDFTHALIRATLYDELSTPRRVMLHRHVAESLEVLYAGEIEEHLGELATHYLASSGGDAQRAIDYSIRAADRARQMFAWEEAAAHYERALQAMDMARLPEDARRCEVMLALGYCDLYTGPPNIDRLRETAAIARRLGSPDLFAQAARLFEQSTLDDQEDRSTERLALLDEALDLLGLEPSTQLVHVMCDRVIAAAAFASARAGRTGTGFAATAGPRDRELMARAREALAIAIDLGDDEAIATASVTMHNYTWSPDNLQERLHLFERASISADRAGSAVAKALVLEFKACTLVEAGDMPGYRAVATAFADHLESTRYELPAYFPRMMVVALDATAGSLSAAERGWNEYVQTLPPGANSAANSVSQLALIRHLQGRSSELETVWSGIVGQFPAMPVYASFWALLLAQQGSPDTASVLERWTASDATEISRDFLWKATMYMFADASAEIEHRESAEVLYRHLMPYASANAAIILTAPLGAIARVLGRLAALFERWDEAEKHFRFAIATNDLMGFHAWTAWTRLNYGDMLVRRNCADDREHAIRLLNEALEFAKQSGMGKVQRDSERLLSTALS